MKIRIAMLSSDKDYMNRLVSVFNIQYSDKMEIYSFTEPEMAIMALSEHRIDVFVSGTAYDIDESRIPQRCELAYFTDSPDIEIYKGKKTVFRFQKADMIYRRILDIYADVAGDFTGLRPGVNSSRVILYMSPCGGTGSSTAAAAYAQSLAARGEKTIYLNFEKWGFADTFFDGAGQFGMSDLIYAIKSKKSNIQIKAESCVKTDKSGVDFYAKTKKSADILELTVEDIHGLVLTLNGMGKYKNIVIDMDFELSVQMLRLMRMAERIVWTTDGTPSANEKIKRALETLALMEQDEDGSVVSQIEIFYNKFVNGKSKYIDNIKSSGCFPLIDGDIRQIMQKLAQSE